MSPASTRREPAFPKRVLVDQGAFALLSWPVYTLFVFAVTFVVSLFRDVSASGWDMAGQPMRWFAFAIGIYLGWSVLQLHVTHGGTRKGFMVQMLVFVPIFVALLTVIFALSFMLESGYYALMGWPQGIDDGALYSGPFDLPMVLLQYVLIFALWTLGGLLIAAAWYRSAILGAAAIPLGLAAVSVSALVLGGEGEGPMVWVSQVLPIQPGPPVATIAHLLLAALFAGLTWLAVRNVPIRSKAAAG